MGKNERPPPNRKGTWSLSKWSQALWTGGALVMSTAYCVGEARRGAQQKNSHRLHRGSSNPTHLIFWLIVRHWKAVGDFHRVLVNGSCERELSRYVTRRLLTASDHFPHAFRSSAIWSRIIILTLWSPSNLPVNLQHQCQLLPLTSILVLIILLPLHICFSTPPQLLAPWLLFFSYSHPRLHVLPSPPGTTMLLIPVSI